MRTIGIDPGDHAAKVVELDGSYKKTRLLHVGLAPAQSNDAAARTESRAEAVAVAMGEGRRGHITLAHPCREAMLRPLELPFTGAMRSARSSRPRSRARSRVARSTT